MLESILDEFLTDRVFDASVQFTHRNADLFHWQLPDTQGR
jgi:hypothetical protein